MFHHQLILNIILFNAESSKVVNVKISHCILVYRCECQRRNCCLCLQRRRRILFRRWRLQVPLPHWCLSTKLHGITLPVTIIFILFYFLLGSLIPTKAEGRNTLVVGTVLPCVMYTHISTNLSVSVSMTREKLRPQKKKNLWITSSYDLIKKKKLEFIHNMMLCALSVFFHRTVNYILHTL